MKFLKLIYVIKWATSILVKVIQQIKEKENGSFDYSLEVLKPRGSKSTNDYFKKHN